jgi:uncharacterized protein YndB with AHSA1/START domain
MLYGEERFESVRGRQDPPVAGYQPAVAVVASAKEGELTCERKVCDVGAAFGQGDVGDLRRKQLAGKCGELPRPVPLDRPLALLGEGMEGLPPVEAEQEIQRQRGIEPVTQLTAARKHVDRPTHPVTSARHDRLPRHVDARVHGRCGAYAGHQWADPSVDLGSKLNDERETPNAGRGGHDLTEPCALDRVLLITRLATRDLHGIQQQLGFGVEDEVDGLDRDTRVGRDRLHRRSGVSLAAETAQGRVDDPATGGARSVAPLRARGTWCSGGGLDDVHSRDDTRPTTSDSSSDESTTREGPMTAIIENTVEIARKPEAVFDYLADQGNEVHWNPDCLSMEQLTDGPVGVGTRFRAKWKQGPAIESVCTRFERPKAWRYENGGPVSVVLTVTLEPTSNGGTRMTSHGEWTPHGWFRAVFPLFIRVMRRAERGVVANARRALEEGRDSAGGAVVQVAR